MAFGLACTAFNVTCGARIRRAKHLLSSSSQPLQNTWRRDVRLKDRLSNDLSSADLSFDALPPTEPVNHLFIVIHVTSSDVIVNSAQGDTLVSVEVTC